MNKSKPFMTPIVLIGSPILNISTGLIAVWKIFFVRLAPIWLCTFLIPIFFDTRGNEGLISSINSLAVIAIFSWIFCVILESKSDFLLQTQAGRNIKLMIDTLLVIRDIPSGVCKQRKLQSGEIDSIHRFIAKGKDISQMKITVQNAQGEKVTRTMDEHCREILFYEGKPKMQEALKDQLEGLTANKKTNFISCSTLQDRVLNYRFLRDIWEAI